MARKPRKQRSTGIDWHPGMVDVVNEIDRAAVNRREIVIAQPIDNTVLHYLIKVLGHLCDQNEDPITIYLNTPGGSVVDGLAVYDLLKKYNKHTTINIIATGACMSMGLIILQAGAKRLATPHTTFLMHEVQGMNVGSLSRMADTQKVMMMMQEVLDKLVADRAGISAKQVRKLFERKEYFLNSDEALQHNLIDGIVE